MMRFLFKVEQLLLLKDRLDDVIRLIDTPSLCKSILYKYTYSETIRKAYSCFQRKNIVNQLQNLNLSRLNIKESLFYILSGCYYDYKNLYTTHIYVSSQTWFYTADFCKIGISCTKLHTRERFVIIWFFKLNRYFDHSQKHFIMQNIFYKFRYSNV